MTWISFSKYVWWLAAAAILLLMLGRQQERLIERRVEETRRLAQTECQLQMEKQQKSEIQKQKEKVVKDAQRKMQILADERPDFDTVLRLMRQQKL